MKPKTRLSLYYLAFYLFFTGVGLLFAPQFSLKLLFSNGHYDNAFVEFTGAFMIAISIIVSQIIRHSITVLYPTTLVVRVFFIVVIIMLYIQTYDPLFLVVLAVVSLGVLLTAVAFVAERNAH
ncbi:MAG TPA: hypothetical protein VIE69_06065 [Methylophilaceae bacterium]